MRVTNIHVVRCWSCSKHPHPMFVSLDVQFSGCLVSWQHASRHNGVVGVLAFGLAGLLAFGLGRCCSKHQLSLKLPVWSCCSRRMCEDWAAGQGGALVGRLGFLAIFLAVSPAHQGGSQPHTVAPPWNVLLFACSHHIPRNKTSSSLGMK